MPDAFGDVQPLEHIAGNNGELLRPVSGKMGLCGGYFPREDLPHIVFVTHLNGEPGKKLEKVCVFVAQLAVVKGEGTFGGPIKAIQHPDGAEGPFKRDIEAVPVQVKNAHRHKICFWVHG